MNENSTVEKMRRLHLKAMAGLYNQSLTDQHYSHYTTDELLALLVDAEWEHRQKTRINSLIRRQCTTCHLLKFYISKGLAFMPIFSLL